MPAFDAEFTPVDLITGFLGAGKTTLLRRLLAQPALHDAAVLVNEFGEIGLDHHLLERIAENTVLLPSGCVCCTVRGELADALRALHSQRESGQVPWFRRVLIESTGLADPYPILSTLHVEPVLRHHFRIGQVVTVVDAVHAHGQLDEHEAGVRQVAAADHLVLSKRSLADAAAVQVLVQRLRGINPQAQWLDAENDGIDAEQLLCAVAPNPHAPNAVRTQPVEMPAPPESGHYLGCYVGTTPRRAGRHDADVRAIAIAFDTPLDWTRFALWLTMLVHRHGSRLLRIKGLLNVQGSDTPVAVHGVQHLIHPPQHLAAWPDAERRSQLVFIAKGLEREAIERSLNVFVGVAGAPGAPDQTASLSNAFVPAGH